MATDEILKTTILQESLERALNAYPVVIDGDTLATVGGAQLEPPEARAVPKEKSLIPTNTPPAPIWTVFSNKVGFHFYNCFQMLVTESDSPKQYSQH